MMRRAIAATLLPVMLALAVASFQGVDVSVEAGILIESLLISTTEFWVEVSGLHPAAEPRPHLAAMCLDQPQRSGGRPASGGPRRARTKVG